MKNQNTDTGESGETYDKEQGGDPSPSKIERRRRRFRSYALAAIFASVIFMGGYAYALTTLGSQSLPSFAIQTPNPFVFCNNLTPGQSVTPNFVSYTCSAPADAFQVTFNANVVPAFNLTNTGFDELWLH